MLSQPMVKTYCLYSLEKVTMRFPCNRALVLRYYPINSLYYTLCPLALVLRPVGHRSLRPVYLSSHAAALGYNHDANTLGVFLAN